MRPAGHALTFALLLSAAGARGDGRRVLVEPTYAPHVLRGKIYGKYVNAPFEKGFVGKQVRREAPHPELVGKQYNEALSRLVDFDPTRTLLDAKDWAEIEYRGVRVEKQVKSEAENIVFTLVDPVDRLQQTRRFVEKARGRLGAILVSALGKRKPSPEALAEVCDGLAKKFPFFENPFQVELLIGDMAGMAPKLGRWRFAKPDPTLVRGKLPRRIQAVLKDLGQRVFAHTNVLVMDHAYADAHVTLDAMVAGGLDPANARFVTTPYPFDAGVRSGILARGIQIAHAPYSVEQTEAAIEAAIRELLKKSDENHGPVVILEDGGLSAKVVAAKFPREMHRIRIVEITKGGERIAKATLPKQLKVDWHVLKGLDGPSQAAAAAQYVNAVGSDPLSREQAARAWKEHIGLISMTREAHAAIDGDVYGFGHYTYSDSKYKREVMTPRYTQAVNRATFGTIERAGMKLNNQRVTIIGGGVMGIHTALELRDAGHEITFVEKDPAQRELLHTKYGFPREKIFATDELRKALPGAGLVMELSGAHDILTAQHLFLIDDGAHVVHGSSKDNPFDMDTFKQLAVEVHDWPATETGQVSKSYVFEAAGRRRTLHFPGNGFTISHGGWAQNVPTKKILPEVGAVLRLVAHAIADEPVSHFPFYTSPLDLAKPGVQKRALQRIPSAQ